MDCCCQRQQSTLTQYSINDTIKNTTPKLKYSFRTQQATSYNSNTRYTTNYTTIHTPNYNTLTASSFMYNQKQKMVSTAASNNQLLQLERQRQLLINQDKQLDMFYQTKIIPLEKEVQFFQHQVKVRNIQIMELQDLLNQRLKQKHLIQQTNNHTQQRNNQTQPNLINNNQMILARSIIPQQNIPTQAPYPIQSQIPLNNRVVVQQPLIIPDHQTPIHHIRSYVSSPVTVRPQPVYN